MFDGHGISFFIIILDQISVSFYFKTQLLKKNVHHFIIKSTDRLWRGLGKRITIGTQVLSCLRIISLGISRGENGMGDFSVTHQTHDVETTLNQY
jgi:hypothetical protein